MGKAKNSIPPDETQDKGSERRLHPRLMPSAIPDLRSIRIQGGSEVNIINISRRGALLETQERVSPGAAISIRLVAADAVFLLRGRVLRSRAKSMRQSIPVYEAAIEFQTDFSVLAEAPDEKQTLMETASMEFQDDPQTESAIVTYPEENPERVEGDQKDWYEFTAFISPSGHDLCQIFGLNNW